MWCEFNCGLALQEEEDVLFNNMYTNSLKYLSQDLYGDSQWQKFKSPLAVSHLQCKEIICSYIVIN